MLGAGSKYAEINKNGYIVHRSTLIGQKKGTEIMTGNHQVLLMMAVFEPDTMIVFDELYAQERRKMVMV